MNPSMEGQYSRYHAPSFDPSFLCLFLAIPLRFPTSFYHAGVHLWMQYHGLIDISYLALVINIIVHLI